MHWAPWFDGPRCRDCGHIADRDAVVCPECEGFLTAIPGGDLDAPIDRSPIEAIDRDIDPGETPLVRSRWLEREAPVERVFIKDEGRNPTGHASDRDMQLVAAAASLLSLDVLGLPSPGRTGVAAANAAAGFDRDIEVFVPARAPFPTKAMINVHGGEMTVVGGRYPDASTAYERARQDTEWWSAQPHRNPYAHAGRGSQYFEILRALDGDPPDAIVVPTGSGTGIIALADVAAACEAADIASPAPRIVAAQPAGCAPVADAYTSDLDRIGPVDAPDTICGELEIPDPPAGNAMLAAVRASNGEAIAVPDPAALEAAVGLADTSGISASVAGGVAAAAATDLTTGTPDDTIVVVNPGAGGLDADVLRSHLMSKGI